jgi:hypothetical protein
MLIELLVATALAGPLNADPFSVGVPLETDLVGLAFGARPGGGCTPSLGVGVEIQSFFISGHPIVARPSYVFEAGLDVTVRGPWSAGVVLEVGFAPPPSFGFGAAVRCGVKREL